MSTSTSEDLITRLSAMMKNFAEAAGHTLSNDLREQLLEIRKLVDRVQRAPVRLELGEGDTREAKVHWTYWLGDEFRVCASVHHRVPGKFSWGIVAEDYTVGPYIVREFAPYKIGTKQVLNKTAYAVYVDGIDTNYHVQSFDQALLLAIAFRNVGRGCASGLGMLYRALKIDTKENTDVNPT